ncbi:NfeD family protein [Rhodoligotrophos defluvii]|uniref:NfeD family protein n=1 Tax=Rhodoligotrophos defluvii TaxID=2561934 RepID=UPI0010C9F2C9|nr:nodulation protein NfeD [Rhodoligotrophos defluvii]
MPASPWSLLLLAAALLFATLAVVDPARPQDSAAGRTAILLDVKGAIGPATTDYIAQGLATAADRNAAVVILRMDTPGGLASAMRDIIRDILASPVPVVVYVAPGGARAASAGTYILYASHLAAMAPGTNLGAATPVQLGGGQPFGRGEEDGEGEKGTGDPSTAKAVNDAVAFIRGLAELNDRNADWAEQAVREAASLPASAALDQGVIEIIATDLDDLLAKADGRTVRVSGNDVTLRTADLSIAAMEPGWRTRLLGIITNPNIAYILLLVGMYGIIFEFVSGGAIFPGVIGGISLILGLFALNLLPINYAGVALILLGVALMVAEVFAPSFGVLGIGGVTAFAIGSFFLFDEVPGFQLSPAVVVTASLLSAILLVIVLAAAVRAHRRQVVSGSAAIIGAKGEVRAWSHASGLVHIAGEQWQARASKPLSPGQKIRVTGRDGLTLIVEPEGPTPEGGGL